jgi:hypothetical protein
MVLSLSTRGTYEEIIINSSSWLLIYNYMSVLGGETSTAIDAFNIGMEIYKKVR